MKTPKETLPKTKPKRWRVSIMRQRGHNVGTVAAPDAKAAESEAVKLFGLTYDERKRLFIWERE
jgi:hypothetical protein